MTTDNVPPSRAAAPLEGAGLDVGDALQRSAAGVEAGALRRDLARDGDQRVHADEQRMDDGRAEQRQEARLAESCRCAANPGEDLHEVDDDATDGEGLHAPSLHDERIAGNPTASDAARRLREAVSAILVANAVDYANASARLTLLEARSAALEAHLSASFPAAR